MINALIVPLIVVSILRSPQWTPRLAVSRQILMHSATISGAAAYLLLMAAAGYYLRYFGGSWGPIMQAAFLFAALMLLMGTLFSGTFRSRLKVFISKHFYNYNYDYREEWLRFTRTLSERGPGLEQRAIRAIADLVESRAGIGKRHAAWRKWYWQGSRGAFVASAQSTQPETFHCHQLRGDS